MDDSAITTFVQIQAPAVKFWHAIVGLYVWDFFMTLDYEWEVIRGRLPYRWTIWIYSITRVATLVGLVICLAAMDVSAPINCQFWISFSVILFYVSATTASLLIVLRIIAIWNKNRVVVILAIAVWGVTVAFHLQNVTQLRSVWIPTQRTCETVKIESSLLSFMPTIISLTILLLIMLVGLVNLRRHDGPTCGLISLLWKQGLIWLALATVAEIPPVVLIMLKINNQLNVMFETPTLITITIAATRMHRSLIDFASKTSEVVHEDPQLDSSIVILKPKRSLKRSLGRTDTGPTALEVAVHTVFEQHPTDLVCNDDSSATSISVSPTPLLVAQAV